MDGKSITDERINDIDGKVEVSTSHFEIFSTFVHHGLSASLVEILTMNNIEEPRIKNYVVSSFQNF